LWIRRCGQPKPEEIERGDDFVKFAENAVEPENAYQDGGTSPPQVHNVDKSVLKAQVESAPDETQLPSLRMVEALIDPLPKVPAELKQVPGWGDAEDLTTRPLN
jgi:hypothetical protein